MTDPSKRIWACLHDEMSAEEKEHFQESLRDNEELRASMERCQETHRVLDELLPKLYEEVPHEELTEQLVAEWDAEHPEYGENEAADTPSKQKRKGSILRFSVPLAAAAALAVIFTLPLQTGPVRWQRTVIGTAQLRGEESTANTQARIDLKKIDRTIRKTVETACSRKNLSDGKWTFRLHLQELANGAFSAELNGHSLSSPDRTMQWNENFLSQNAFLQKLPLLEQQITEGISGSAD